MEDYLTLERLKLKYSLEEVVLKIIELKNNSDTLKLYDIKQSNIDDIKLLKKI